MGKTLVILESPAKAKKVAGYLGSDYIVKASVGHIRDIPLSKTMTASQKEKYGDYGIDVQSPSFEALYKNDPGKSKVISELKADLAKCDTLVLMTDDDAEGHAISWHLLEVLQPKVPVYRAITHEITKTGVEAALKSMEKVDAAKKEPRSFYGAAESALTRGSWDRLYGFATSPYVWKTIKPGTSSGRVQSPGARLVVERELKRLAFKAVSFYSITGNFDGTTATLVEVGGKKIASGANIDDEGVVADGYVLITDENVDKVLDFLQKRQYSVGEVTSKPYRRSAPPPFTTSSALQSIGAKTRMSSKQITSIFQALYQDGDITYIRTVSVVAAPEAIAAARKSIEKTYGKQYLPAQAKVFKDKKEGNSGHECIRPTLDSKGLLLDKKFGDSKTQGVFDAIQKRMMASQAIDCEGTTWTATFVSDDKKAVFSTSETEIHEAGWTKIYDTEADEASSGNEEKEN